MVSFTPLEPPVLIEKKDTPSGLDEMEKWKFLTLLELELQHLGCTARSQSLYRLRSMEKEQLESQDL
jgi:hypothetical protein